jgi:hypothetical protein
LGFASSQLSEWLKDRRAYEREQASRVSTRRDKQLERRNDFQRQTLLELQEEAIKVIQNASACHHVDKMSIRKNGKRGQEPYPEAINLGVQLANARTALLGVRVHDEEVRSLLKRFKDQCSFAFLDDDEDMREALIQAAGSSFVELNNRIGKILRLLDDVELAA